ncbi:MAG TPA: LysM domain-containing protein [Burkholderiaceae bacterium]
MTSSPIDTSMPASAAPEAALAADPLPLGLWPGFRSSYRFFAPIAGGTDNLALHIAVAPHDYLPAGRVDAAEAARRASDAAGRYREIAAEMRFGEVDWTLATSLGKIEPHVPQQAAMRRAMFGLATAAHVFMNQAAMLQAIAARTGKDGFETLSAIIDSTGHRPGYPLSFAQLAEANAEVRADMLFGPRAQIGVPRGDANPGKHTVAEGETLADIAQVEGVSVEALMAANSSLKLAEDGALSIPGLADYVFPDGMVPPDFVYPDVSVYRTGRGESLQGIAERCGDWKAADMVGANWDLPAILAPVPLTFGETTLTPTMQDSFRSVAEQFGLTIPGFAAQFAALPGLVADGAYLYAPAIAARKAETVDACCARFNLDCATLMSANACLPGVLQCGQTLEIDGGCYGILPNESLTLLRERINTERAARGLAPLHVGELAARTGALALSLRRLISPPRGERFTATAVPSYAVAVDELVVEIIAHDQKGGTIPARLTAAPFTSLHAAGEAMERFASEFETMFAGLKLAQGWGEAMFVANFSGKGDALAYAVKEGGLRFFAMPPLVRRPWNGKGVAVPTYDSARGMHWPSGNAYEFADTDPNLWQRQFFDAIEQTMSRRAAMAGRLDDEFEGWLGAIDSAGYHLAASIARTALPLFDGDDAGDADLAQVRLSLEEEFRRNPALVGRMQTAVRFPIEVSGQGAQSDPALAPRMRGRMQVRSPDQLNRLQRPPAVRFGSGEAELVTGHSHIIAPFELGQAAGRRSISLALDYRAEQLQLRGRTPYLDFALPFSQGEYVSGRIERAALIAPLFHLPASTVLSHEAAAPAWPADPQVMPLHWTYHFACAPQLAVQDELRLEVGFESLDSVAETPAGKEPNDTYIRALAAFVAAWPAVSADLARPWDEADTAVARAAAMAFAYLAQHVSQAWKPPGVEGPAASARADLAYALTVETAGEPPYLSALHIDRLGKDADGLDQPDDFLFLAEAGLGTGLDEARVDGRLREQFARQGFPLGAGCKLKVNAAGRDWTLQDHEAQQSAGAGSRFRAPQIYRLLMKTMASGTTRLAVYRQILWPALKLQGDADWQGMALEGNRLRLALAPGRYAALDALGLEFAFYRMNPFLRQNAWAKATVTRNRSLRPDAATNPAFVMRNLPSRFTSSVDATAIAADPIELQGETLAQALTHYFNELFSAVALAVPSRGRDDAFHLKIDAMFSRPLEGMAPSTVDLSLFAAPPVKAETGGGAAAEECYAMLAGMAEAAVAQLAPSASAQGRYRFHASIYRSAEDAREARPLLELMQLEYALTRKIP